MNDKGSGWMYKAYKFRIYPNEEQRCLINKSFGCARFVYNYYLNKIIKDGYISANACIKDYVDNLKYEYRFLTEIDSIIIRKSLFNLEDSFKRYLNKIADYPKYILTMDMDLDADYDGIKKINVVDWLLNKDKY